jgi:predicted MFS family arabinose efflux permease
MKPLHLLLVLAIFNHMTFVGARLAVLLYAAYLGASPVVVGVIASLFALVGIVTSVGIGRWIDRAGPRTPLILSTVVMVAGGVVPFFWRDVMALVLTAILIGTFHNVFHIAQNQLVGRYGRPEDRTSNFSLSSLANSAATFFGPVLTGLAVDHWGHPLAFLALALCALIPLPFIVFNILTYPDSPAPSKKQGGKTPSAWGLLRDPPLRRIYVASVLTNGTWSVVNFLIPLYGLQSGLGATQIGILMGTFAAATVLIRIVITFFSRRFTPWQMMVGALFTTGTGFLAMPFTQIYAVLLVISFWLGLGLGVAGPMTMSLLFDASPPDRTGEVVGLRVTLQNLCQTAVPLLSGAIGTATGVGPVFWVISALVLWGCYDNRRQLRPAPAR